ncbi:hypothetical protein, partial [Serratia marcescens]|uniref:hypothetical protein n=1 Tax=Serratia marcescens TaxID=615 RepID=UPI001954664A
CQLYPAWPPPIAPRADGDIDEGKAPAALMASRKPWSSGTSVLGDKPTLPESQPYPKLAPA